MNDKNTSLTGDEGLTSHEMGWHGDDQDQVVKETPKPGSEIEAIIGRAKQKAKEDKQAKQRELEERRDAALASIGHAADQAMDLEGDGLAVLHARLERASKVRISEAEAMAELAVYCQDFESPLFWWDIKEDPNNPASDTAWKGYVLGYWVGTGEDAYVVAKRESRIKTGELDIVVCKNSRGGFVAEVDGPAGRAAGLASKEDGVPEEDLVKAAIRAGYIAYHVGRLKYPLTLEQFPESIFDGVDLLSETEYKE